jgi:hypothetical protein
MNRHPLRDITAEEVETYQRDGIVCLRQLFDPEWITFLRDLVDEDMAAPSEMSKNVNQKGASGLFFFDTFVAHHLSGFMQAVLNGPGGEAAGRVMKADKAKLIFDLLAGGGRTNCHPLVGAG